MLCNDARLGHDAAGGWQLVGDPTEGALLPLACKAGLDPLEAARDEVPAFFGYPAWSCAALLPLFAVVTWLV